MPEEKYNVDLKCCNCKRSNWNVSIPRGMTIEEFGQGENVKCKHCGCNVIKIKEKKEK